MVYGSQQRGGVFSFSVYGSMLFSNRLNQKVSMENNHKQCGVLTSRRDPLESGFQGFLAEKGRINQTGIRSGDNGSGGYIIHDPSARSQFTSDLSSRALIPGQMLLERNTCPGISSREVGRKQKAREL